MKHVKSLQNIDKIFSADYDLPWNGLQLVCVKILEIYCKVFGIFSNFHELSRFAFYF